MKESEFLASLQDLSGKVAVVVGGTQGIGQSTVVYLALRGAVVYACAPDIERERSGLAKAIERVKKQASKSPAPGKIYFHELDLSSIRQTKNSATALRERLIRNDGTRLDILVNNAGILSTSTELTEDGFEMTFEVNCLGHFVFINALLDFIQTSAESHGEARITLTASAAYTVAKRLNYDLFTTTIPKTARSSLALLKESMKWYVNSKLGIIFIAMELARRLDEAKVKNVYVNAVHPGSTARTQIGNWEQKNMTPQKVQGLKRILFVGYLLSYSPEDAAKTQTYLSASPLVSEKHITGEFWSPLVSWKPIPGYWMRYKKCRREKLRSFAERPDEWAKFWEYCEAAMLRDDNDKHESQPVVVEET